MASVEVDMNTSARSEAMELQGNSAVDSDVSFRNFDDTFEEDFNTTRETNLCSVFKSQDLPEYEDEVSQYLHMEHGYTKHWELSPVSNPHIHQHPAATKLFSASSERALTPAIVDNYAFEQDDFIDIEGDPSDIPHTINYQNEKATKQMLECERHIRFANPASDHPENVKDGEFDGNISEDNENTSTANNQLRAGWSRQQERLYDRANQILDWERLARLGLSGSTHEPIKRRALLDRSAARWRHLLATCRWDVDLCRWLHNALLSTLSRPYLVAYLDILQSLHYLCPDLIDNICSIAGNKSPSLLKSAAAILGNSKALVHPAGNAISSLGLNLLLKRPWDPTVYTLHRNKPKKLDPKRSPIVIVVPCSPQPNPAQARRHKHFNSQLNHVASVKTVNVPYNAEYGLQYWLEEMVRAVRDTIDTCKATASKDIVLLGWGTAAIIACQLSSVEPSISGVVCLSMPFSGREDFTSTKGLPDSDYVTTLDTLLSINCPVMLVQGDRCIGYSIENVKSLRTQLHHRSQLVIVCGGNSNLRLSAIHRYRAALTSSVVDRAIVEEVSSFLESVMPEPPPPPPEPVLPVPAAADVASVPEGDAPVLPTGMVPDAANKEALALTPSSPKYTRPGTPVASLANSSARTAGVTTTAVVRGASGASTRDEILGHPQHITVTSAASQATPSIPSTPSTPTATNSTLSSPAVVSATSTPVRGMNKRGRRPGRGRGRGSGRALPPEQLIPLGGGVGVAHQAHINSAGARRSAAMPPRASRGRAAVLPNALSAGHQDGVLLNSSSVRGGRSTGGARPVTIKEQMTQAAVSEAQLLAAVASITPQSPPKSPQRTTGPGVVSHIVTPNTSFIPSLAAQPITILPSSHNIAIDIQQSPQPSPGTSFVVSSVGTMSLTPRPQEAIVTGTLVSGRPSLNARKAAAAGGTTTPIGTIQNTPIVFHSSQGSSVSSGNRIILPHSSHSSTESLVVATSTLPANVSLLGSTAGSLPNTSTVTTRFIRPNTTLCITPQRMNTSLIMASPKTTLTPQQYVTTSGAVRAGRTIVSNTSGASVVYGVTGDARPALNRIRVNTGAAVQGFNSSPRLHSPTVRGRISSLTVGTPPGIFRSAIATTPSPVAVKKGSTPIRGVTPIRTLVATNNDKRSLISIAGGANTAKASNITLRGTNFVLTSMPVTAASPSTVDASTCTSPSLPPVAEGSLGQQGQIILHMQQKSDQTNIKSVQQAGVKIQMQSKLVPSTLNKMITSSTQNKSAAVTEDNTLVKKSATDITKSNVLNLHEMSFVKVPESSASVALENLPSTSTKVQDVIKSNPISKTAPVGGIVQANTAALTSNATEKLDSDAHHLDLSGELVFESMVDNSNPSSKSSNDQKDIDKNKSNNKESTDNSAMAIPKTGKVVKANRTAEEESDVEFLGEYPISDEVDDLSKSNKAPQVKILSCPTASASFTLPTEVQSLSSSTISVKTKQVTNTEAVGPENAPKASNNEKHSVISSQSVAKCSIETPKIKVPTSLINNPTEKFLVNSQKKNTTIVKTSKPTTASVLTIKSSEAFKTKRNPLIAVSSASFKPMLSAQKQGLSVSKELPVSSSKSVLSSNLNVVTTTSSNVHVISTSQAFAARVIVSSPKASTSVTSSSTSVNSTIIPSSGLALTDSSGPSTPSSVTGQMKASSGVVSSPPASEQTPQRIVTKALSVAGSKIKVSVGSSSQQPAKIRMITAKMPISVEQNVLFKTSASNSSKVSNQTVEDSIDNDVIGALQKKSGTNKPTLTDSDKSPLPTHSLTKVSLRDALIDIADVKGSVVDNSSDTPKKLSTSQRICKKDPSEVKTPEVIVISKTFSVKDVSPRKSDIPKSSTLGSQLMENKPKSSPSIVSEKVTERRSDKVESVKTSLSPVKRLKRSFIEVEVTGSVDSTPKLAKTDIVKKVQVVDPKSVISTHRLNTSVRRLSAPGLGIPGKVHPRHTDPKVNLESINVEQKTVKVADRLGLTESGCKEYKTSSVSDFPMKHQETIGTSSENEHSSEEVDKKVGKSSPFKKDDDPSDSDGKSSSSSGSNTTTKTQHRTGGSSSVRTPSKSVGGKMRRRASVRLSLTPYEQAANLRSGKKRPSY